MRTLHFHHVDHDDLDHKHYQHNVDDHHNDVSAAHNVHNGPDDNSGPNNHYPATEAHRGAHSRCSDF
jgi:uncharacterized protein involved in copper resistance